MRTCLYCSSNIEHKATYAKYCSLKCKDVFWRENNKDKYFKINRKWKDNNKEHRLKVSREQYKKDPGRFIAKVIAYKCAKSKAMPKWLTKQHIKEIKLFYKNCPKGYQVDHIVPLRGKEVSGLHVPWNLQYLTEHENLSKGNKYRI